MSLVKDTLRKTVGGLSREYYWRHFLTALAYIVLPVLAVIYLYDMREVELSPQPYMIVVLVLAVFMLLVYPYSRFVYDRLVSFIMGDSVFLVNPLLLFFWRFFVFIICMKFSFVLAPAGMIYLYYYHTKQERQSVN